MLGQITILGSWEQDSTVWVVDGTNQILGIVNWKILKMVSLIWSQDVSFISLRIILPVLKEKLFSAGGDVLALIKLQFEANRNDVRRKRIIPISIIHQEVI